MMDYIKYMRKMIGKNPMFLVGSGVLIINKENKILLIRRTDNNTWGIPGGSMELGETFEETAIREVFEETGLRVNELELLDVFSGKEVHHIYPNGNEVYNAVCIFTTHSYDGKMNSDGKESSDIRFFHPDDLPAEINPPDIVVLKRYMEKE